MNKAEQHPLKRALWHACDVMRNDDNCNGVRHYVEHLTWLLVLKFLDQNRNLFRNHVSFIDERYRWTNWVTKFMGRRQLPRDTAIPSECCEMELLQFVKNELIPYLGTLSGTAEKEVIASFFLGPTVVCNSPRNLSNLIAIVDNLDSCQSSLHVYAEFYEELLQKLGNEDISSGEFLVPPPLAHSIIQILNPKNGETIYDPSCGSGGLLVEALKHLKTQDRHEKPTREILDHTVWGFERKPLAALIGSLNVSLHGLSRSQILRQNALEHRESNIPQHFDVIISNPPFGLHSTANTSKVGQGQRKSAEVLFVEHILDKLRPGYGARCGIIVSDGMLFRPGYFEETRKTLAEQFNISLIVSLPSGCFPYTSAKTSMVFFNVPGPTKEVLYYEIAISRHKKKANQKNQIRDDDFTEMHEVWNGWRAYLTKEAKRPVLPESSWTLTLDQIRAGNYDLSPRSTNRVVCTEPTNSTSELLTQLAADGRELMVSVDRLSKLFNENEKDE